MLKDNRMEHAIWSENKVKGQIVLSAGFIWFLYQYTGRKAWMFVPLTPHPPSVISGLSFGSFFLPPFSFFCLVVLLLLHNITPEEGTFPLFGQEKNITKTPGDWNMVTWYIYFLPLLFGCMTIVPVLTLYIHII